MGAQFVVCCLSYAWRLSRESAFVRGPIDSSCGCFVRSFLASEASLIFPFRGSITKKQSNDFYEAGQTSHYSIPYNIPNILVIVN